MLETRLTKSRQEFEELLEYMYKNKLFIADRFKTECIESFQDFIKNLLCYSIIETENESVVGCIVILNLDSWNHRAEIRFTYYLYIEDTAILDIFNKFFFFELNLHRIYWITEKCKVSAFEKLHAFFEGEYIQDSVKYCFYSMVGKNRVY